MSDNDNTITLSQQEYINMVAHKITHDVVAETKVDIDRLRKDSRDDLASFKSDVNRRFNEVDKRFERIEHLLYWVVGIGITSVVLPIVLPIIKSNLTSI